MTSKKEIESAAAMLGRRGGLKGGKARAKALGKDGMSRAAMKGWRTRRARMRSEKRRRGREA
jgi:hypothetical protein